MDSVKNFAKVTVSQGYDDAAVSIDLESGDGSRLPDPSVANFNLVWWNSTDYPDPADDPNREIVRCTGKSTDTLTIVRAQESTSAATHNTAGKTYKMILGATAKTITDIYSDLMSFLTATGDVDDSNTVFTFAEAPLLIVQNGAMYRNGKGVTISGTSATLDYPVGIGGDIFGIKG